MVMEYAEHELRELLEKRKFAVAEVKCLLKQLLSAMCHLHDRWVMHRDLKTSNILLTNGGILKVCDFGLARHYGEPDRIYTRNVITLWYRAPELLMGQRRYTTAVDIWSIGCVFAEIFLRKPLFSGGSELHQLTLIYELTGEPSEDPYFWERPYPMDASMMATFQETNSAAHERRTPARKPNARSLAIGSMAAAVSAASGGVRGLAGVL